MRRAVRNTLWGVFVALYTTGVVAGSLRLVLVAVAVAIILTGKWMHE